MIISCQPFVLYITFSTFVMYKNRNKVLRCFIASVPQIQFRFVPTASKLHVLPRLSIVKHLISSDPLCKVLDPEKQADLLDSLRICLLQFSTLLVEHAPHHIHDNNKSRNSKLRRLMTFAWPCLLPKACVDPACKYSGHLLLAHIIAKFAIHKKIVLQVRKRRCKMFTQIKSCIVETGLYNSNKLRR